MKMRKAMLTASLILIGLAGPVDSLLAQRGARLVSRPAIEPEQAVLVVPVTVDLTAAEVEGRPVALGAYVVRVDFDSTRLVLIEAVAGNDFASAPTFTTPERANASGVVKLVAAQAGENGPGGIVHVADLRFRVLDRAGSAESVRTEIESLATSLVRDRDGTLRTHAIPLAVPERNPDRREATEQ